MEYLLLLVKTIIIANYLYKIICTIEISSKESKINVVSYISAL